MQRIVINRCLGSFGLSKEAVEALGLKVPTSLKRDDPRLVRVVRKLGAAANGVRAALAVVNVPDGVEWTIEEYDGLEHVTEKHRTWPPRKRFVNGGMSNAKR